MKAYTVAMGTAASAGVNPFEAITKVLGGQTVHLGDNAYEVLNRLLAKMTDQEVQQLHSISCTLIGPVAESDHPGRE